jgi:hypothetical protein
VATTAYVDNQIDVQLTAEDLDVTSDSGTIAIDLDSETLTIAGGEGIDTSGSSNTITIAGENASTSNKGIASFSSDNFAVGSGVVTIKDSGVSIAEINTSSGTAGSSTFLRGDGTWQAAGGTTINGTTDNAIITYINSSSEFTAEAALTYDGTTLTIPGQIAFPATQSASAGANTLDDYEEGTFTPVLNDAGAASDDSTYDAQNGYYTKIGNRVYVDIILTCSGLGTLTGGNPVRIAGLPFQISNATNYAGGAAVGLASSFASTTAGFNVTGDFNNGVTYLTLHIWDIATGSSYMTVTEFSASGHFHMSGCYRI